MSKDGAPKATAILQVIKTRDEKKGRVLNSKFLSWLTKSAAKIIIKV